MRRYALAAAMSVAALSAQAQQFTTGAEIQPIIEMTTANWVAVREWEGQDLLYFTHLEAWRCGMDQVRYFVNTGKPRAREMEPCYIDTNAPNAIKMPDGHVPYDIHPLGLIETVTVEVTLDNGVVLSETFERNAILMP